MEINRKRVLVCDCQGTMKLDGEAVARACGGTDLSVEHQLCRRDLDAFKRAAGASASLLVACTQEAPIFLEALDDLAGPGEAEATPDIRFTNIRERAGWSDEGAEATAKMAALLAEAALDIPSAKSVALKSEGALLVIGTDDTAIEVAKQVASRLDVTVLIAGSGEILPPRLMDVPVFTGKVASAKGHLGAFEVAIDDFAAAVPSSREALRFEDKARSGVSRCDLILDLRGGTPLFAAPEKRDGYFNPDPGNPALVQKALLELTDMVGEFEKPMYVNYEAEICAHSRNGIVGCTRCLDACPAGAIEAAGDGVRIDPYICAGCGSCASVCPTGASTYALPADNALFERARTLLGTYLGAGGGNPALLVQDIAYGDQMIDIMARLGRGLPACVVPFAVNQVTQIGLDFLLAAVSYGASRVLLLASPEKREEAAGLAEQVILANAILGGLGYGDGRIAILEEADPEAMADSLYRLEPLAPVARGDFMPMGKKRSLMELALQRLHGNAPEPVDVFDLPAGAPFGTVNVAVEGCTVCLACVNACPTGALKDNPDKPQLSFREASCIQCGLCQSTCPEKVISLTPRLNFTDQARRHQVVKEEEPFECIRCGKPFGARSSIERMVEKLRGHSMFQDEKRLDLIRMCDDCRILAQTEDVVHPLAAAPRPVPRTTDDYLREREELRKMAAKDMAAKGLTTKEEKEE